MVQRPRVEPLPAPGYYYKMDKVEMPKKLTDGPEWREPQW